VGAGGSCTADHILIEPAVVHRRDDPDRNSHFDGTVHPVTFHDAVEKSRFRFSYRKSRLPLNLITLWISTLNSSSVNFPSSWPTLLNRRRGTSIYPQSRITPTSMSEAFNARHAQQITVHELAQRSPSAGSVGHKVANQHLAFHSRRRVGEVH